MAFHRDTDQTVYSSRAFINKIHVSSRYNFGWKAEGQDGKKFDVDTDELDMEGSVCDRDLNLAKSRTLWDSKIWKIV